MVYLDISDFINRDNNSSRLPIGFEKLDVESFGFSQFHCMNILV